MKATKPTPPPSAYATLCSAVARLASEVGYQAEEEVLRIPSTRNTAIAGRRWRVGGVRADVKAGQGKGDGEAEDGGQQREQRRKDGEDWEDGEDGQGGEDIVRRIVRQELGGREIEEIGQEWRERAARIAGSRGTRDVAGHS